MKRRSKIFTLLFFIALAGVSSSARAQSNMDTMLVKGFVFEGDTLPFRQLEEVVIFPGGEKKYEKYIREWTRLRNAVYVTYPYAKEGGFVFNDVNDHLGGIASKKKRKEYIKSREKELRDKFADKLTDLSVYQGKVLMKLLNRQTGNNCYDIIKEMKGGLTARFYQTVAFFFGSNLKQDWNLTENGVDRQIEAIVQEIERMYTPYYGKKS